MNTRTVVLVNVIAGCFCLIGGVIGGHTLNYFLSGINFGMGIINLARLMNEE